MDAVVEIGAAEWSYVGERTREVDAVLLRYITQSLVPAILVVVRVWPNTHYGDIRRTSILKVLDHLRIIGVDEVGVATRVRGTT